MPSFSPPVHEVSPAAQNTPVIACIHAAVSRQMEQPLLTALLV
jgi:hypothetical protein